MSVFAGVPNVILFLSHTESFCTDAGFEPTPHAFDNFSTHTYPLDRINAQSMSFIYSFGTRFKYSVLDLVGCCGYDFQTLPGGSGDRV